MIIGYTTLAENPVEKERLEVEGHCEEIAVILEGEHTIKHFLSFLEQHKDDQIIVTSIEAIDLSLNHYQKINELVLEKQINLHFLDKELSEDNAYLTLLSELSLRESRMMSKRTYKGLERARKKGKKGGRPKIDSRSINQIQELFVTKRKTIREIADACDVSLGTVHKYTRGEMLRPPHEKSDNSLVN